MDKLRLRISKKKPEPSVAPVESVAPEIEVIKSPTFEIFGVDPETDFILKKIFNGICPAFLDNKCNLIICQRPHVLPAKGLVFGFTRNAHPANLKKAHAVFARFPILFKEYIDAFVYPYVLPKQENFLVQLIRESESHPSLLCCYESIVRGLIEHGNSSVPDAINFLINHYTPNTESRNAILKIIVSVGESHVWKFVDFIRSVMSKQRIPGEILDKLVKTCNDTQDLTFGTTLCLNHLARNVRLPELAEFGEQSLDEFLRSQQNLSKKCTLDDLQSRLVAVASKLPVTRETAALHHELKNAFYNR